MLPRMILVSLLVVTSAHYYQLPAEDSEFEGQCENAQTDNCADQSTLLQTKVHTSHDDREVQEIEEDPTIRDDHGEKEDRPENIDEVAPDATSDSDFFWVGVAGSEYTWGDSQCPLLEDLSGKSLTTCKSACLAKDGCHAININPDTQKCELRGCSQPVPTPHTRHSLGGYDAYFMHLTTAKLCYDGERVEKLAEGGHLCHTDAQPSSSHDVQQLGYYWDKNLPRIENCWNGQDTGKLKSFKFAFKLTKNWVDHYQDKRDDFARHGYNTLQEAPGIFLDKASYLFEQQFGVHLAIGTVATQDANGHYTPSNPWDSTHAGIIRLDTTGRGYSPLGSLCASGEMLGAGATVFDSNGNFRFAGLFTLAHELGHYFGTHHTPMYKPDIMVVDGRPTYRRCGGRKCMYHSFLPWEDTSAYKKTVCEDHIQKATCATLVDAPGPSVSWTLGAENQDCNAACAKAGGTCDEASLSKGKTEAEVEELATGAGHGCARSVGWGYSASPAICTNSRCCGSGSCKDWCTYGDNGKRSCAASAGDYSRLCPCMVSHHKMCADYPCPDGMVRNPDNLQSTHMSDGICCKAKQTWILAQASQSCQAACQAAGKSCDDHALKNANSAAAVKAAAAEAGRSCGKEVGWAYDFSPSICTSSKCCGNGACTGWCTFGNNGKRSCTTATHGHHSQLCPCS